MACGPFIYSQNLTFANIFLRPRAPHLPPAEITTAEAVVGSSSIVNIPPDFVRVNPCEDVDD